MPYVGCGAVLDPKDKTGAKAGTELLCCIENKLWPCWLEKSVIFFEKSL